MDVDIRRVIKERGVNTTELAEKIGVSFTTLHYLIRRGSNLPVERLNEFARHIGCPVTDFFVPETDEEAAALGVLVLGRNVVRPIKAAGSADPDSGADEPDQRIFNEKSLAELTSAVEGMARAVDLMARSVQQLAIELPEEEDDQDEDDE